MLALSGTAVAFALFHIDQHDYEPACVLAELHALPQAPQEHTFDVPDFVRLDLFEADA